MAATLNNTAAQHDDYLAQPPSECCLKGSIHEGEPRGKIESIADIETYVVEPPSGKRNGHILMVFPDVWGLFKNGNLVMDSFSDAGYLVFGIDYFRGDPVWKYFKHGSDVLTEPGFDFPSWKAKHKAFADENVPKWIDGVKEKYGKPETKYACVGYCFGAPYVCDALAQGIVTAGAFAHPTTLKDSHFRNLNGPLFLSCSEIDSTFPTEARNRAIDILIETKKTYQLQLFSGVEHGFALRANLENPWELYVKEKSMEGIAQWFDFWLPKLK